MTITIYHNPKCGTSRNTLEMIRKAGVDPVVIEYLIYAAIPCRAGGFDRKNGDFSPRFAPPEGDTL